MNLNFFKKTNNIPSLKSFHKRPISPDRDWLIILFVCLLYVVISIVISSVFFINSINVDTSEVVSIQDDTSQSINISKLNSAVEFINSRGE